MADELNDDKGRVIQEGDTVLTTAYGGSVPRWLASETGRVIGFTRQGRVKVQFHVEVYDEKLPHRSVPPHYLRVVPEHRQA